jgi:hypothetical protein
VVDDLGLDQRDLAGDLVVVAQEQIRARAHDGVAETGLRQRGARECHDRAEPRQGEEGDHP